MLLGHIHINISRKNIIKNVFRLHFLICIELASGRFFDVIGTKLYAAIAKSIIHIPIIIFVGLIYKAKKMLPYKNKKLVSKQLI